MQFFVIFEKFTRAYLFQIALEIIWLPILTSQFRSFMHWIVFDLFFCCVTVKTIYSSVKTRSLSPSHVWKLSSFFLPWKAVFTHSWIEEFDHKAKEKISAVMMRLSCEMFLTGWETVCKKLLNLVQVALTRNEAKIYQETEFYSSEGYLLNFSWLLPSLLKLLHWMLYRLDFPLEVLTAFC